MTKQTTYRELMYIMQDIENQTREHITFMLFNRHKVAEFKKENRAVIARFDQHLQQILNKYGKKGEDGKILMTQTEQGAPVMQFNSDDDQELFKTEYNQFLNLNIQLHI